ncbi:hypothetical protein B0H67DRAFT_106 [Lasiosphaeris hirsuta]|uniref:Uncharacterized protein n=1 Tax=Lasiosphaeris hirsuta TaxID=260670 RepID=A0AA40B869_9PEZI|nr:hypothetical protein B0H67DRAFT_106 [Lasiosphaeris hirsuta]
MAPRSPQEDNDSDGDRVEDPAVTPLSNPPAAHRLLTAKFVTLADLESALHMRPRLASISAGCGPLTRPRMWASSRASNTAVWREKFGPLRHSRGSRPRAKKGCTWQVVARALACNQRQWALEIRDGCDSHNHRAVAYHMLKNRFIDEHKAFITTYITRPMIPSREIAKDLRGRFPGIIFTARPLKNLRHRLKKATHEGYIPFQLTMALPTILS